MQASFDYKYEVQLGEREVSHALLLRTKNAMSALHIEAPMSLKQGTPSQEGPGVRLNKPVTPQTSLSLRQSDVTDVSSFK